MISGSPEGREVGEKKFLIYLRQRRAKLIRISYDEVYYRRVYRHDNLLDYAPFRKKVETF